MQPSRLLSFILLVTLTWSCKKELTANPVPSPTPPVTSQGQLVKRDHGLPTGEAVKKIITATGGSVQSADGRLAITIPAGAVDGATEFSIQPITNSLKTRGLAYRLQPEDIVFKKDISITYSYAGLPLNNADSKYLFLTYQDAEGYYHEATELQNNKATQTLSVQTKHFSDWTFFSRIELETNHHLQNGIAYLKKNEEMNLDVHTYQTTPGKKDTILDFIFNPDVTGLQLWTLTKPKGTITPNPLLPSARYKAPAAIPQEESLMIHVTLNGNFGTDNLGQPVRQLILGQDVVLQAEDEEYFKVTIDGTDNNLHNLTAEYVPGWISLGGYTPAGDALSIQVFAAGTGTFPYGLAGETGKANMQYTIPNSVGFICFHPETCIGNGRLIFSTGSVTLSKKLCRLMNLQRAPSVPNFFTWIGAARAQQKIFRAGLK